MSHDVIRMVTGYLSKGTGVFISPGESYIWKRSHVRIQRRFQEREMKNIWDYRHSQFPIFLHLADLMVISFQSWSHKGLPPPICDIKNSAESSFSGRGRKFVTPPRRPIRDNKRHISGEKVRRLPGNWFDGPRSADIFHHWIQFTFILYQPPTATQYQPPFSEGGKMEKFTCVGRCVAYFSLSPRYFWNTKDFFFGGRILGEGVKGWDYIAIEVCGILRWYSWLWESIWK